MVIVEEVGHEARARRAGVKHHPEVTGEEEGMSVKGPIVVTTITTATTRTPIGKVRGVVGIMIEKETETEKEIGIGAEAVETETAMTVTGGGGIGRVSPMRG